MKINEKQLSLVDRQIKLIIDSGNYYSEVYKKEGLTGVSTPEDLRKFRLRTKPTSATPTLSAFRRSPTKKWSAFTPPRAQRENP